MKLFDETKQKKKTVSIHVHCTRTHIIRKTNSTLTFFHDHVNRIVFTSTKIQNQITKIHEAKLKQRRATRATHAQPHSRSVNHNESVCFFLFLFSIAKGKKLFVLHALRVHAHKTTLT